MVLAQVRKGLLAILFAAMVVSQYLDFIWSPPEAQMGDTVRILYYHVASATDAFLAFGITAIASIVFLIKKNVFWDRLAAASAEIGLVFTTLVLVSGSIWGEAVWNVWWTWDPTLTSTLILWFLYVGYLLLRVSIANRDRSARVSAVFGIIAAIDLPIIHESVTWWRGIHPSVITATGFNMPPSMVLTLLFSIAVFIFFYLFLLCMVTLLQQDKDALDDLREQVRKKLHQLQNERG